VDALAEAGEIDGKDASGFAFPPSRKSRHQLEKFLHLYYAKRKIVLEDL